MPDELVEGVHYYMEDGFMVFTALYLPQRGYCCESGCRHCPYGFEAGKPERTALDYRSPLSRPDSLRFETKYISGYPNVLPGGSPCIDARGGALQPLRWELDLITCFSASDRNTRASLPVSKTRTHGLVFLFQKHVVNHLAHEVAAEAARAGCQQLYKGPIHLTAIVWPFHDEVVIGKHSGAATPHQQLPAPRLPRLPHAQHHGGGEHAKRSE